MHYPKRGEFDRWYITTLSDDAIPELINALPNIKKKNLREDIIYVLNLNLQSSRNEKAKWQAWQSWHYAHYNADIMLKEAAKTIK